MFFTKRNLLIACLLLGCLAGGFLLGRSTRPSQNLDLESTAAQVRKMFQQDDGLGHSFEVFVFRFSFHS